MLRTAVTLLLATAAAALATAAPAAALPPTDPDSRWIADGDVNAVATVGQTLYLGGDFETLSRRVGTGVAITGGGTTLAEGPEFDKTVNAVISDGAGGFYVGGEFDHVGGVPREGLVHLLPDGSVDPAFTPPPINRSVLALALRGDRLYVGGGMTTAGTEERRGLLAVDRTTGALDPDFHPGVMGYGESVSDLELSDDDGTLFAVGSFSCVGDLDQSAPCDHIGEHRRRHAAAFDADDGNPRPWVPNANAQVRAIQLLPGGDAVLGGHFDCVNSANDECSDFELPQEQRESLAIVDGTTGSTTSFVYDVGSPSGSSHLTDIALDASGRLLIAGRFDCVRSSGDDDCTDPNEAVRHNLARLTTGGTTLTWNPGLAATGTVQTLALDAAGPVVIGGDFHVGNATEPTRIASVDPATGAVTSGPRLNDQVNAIARDDGRIFAGGKFDGADSIDRRYLAAIDLQTGEPTGFDPGVDDTVSALVVDGGRLYMGGDFLYVDGEHRPHLAAFDVASQALTDWAPATNAEVMALAPAGPTVYIGGSFSEVGGQPHAFLGAVDAATGAPAADLPDPDYEVLALAHLDGRLYLGGSFSEVGGQVREHAAAVDLGTGELAPWDPQPDNYVHVLMATPGRVLAGGEFLTVGTTDRPALAALDPVTGAPQDWNAGLDQGDYVFALARDGADLVLGGDLSELNGQPHDGSLAVVGFDDAAARPWDPDTDSSVLGVAAAGGAVYAGGDFDTAGAIAQDGLATFTPAPVNLAPPVATATPEPACDPGRWEGNPVLATSIVPVDGNALVCRVTARNIRGDSAAESAPVAIPRGPDDQTTKPVGAPRITLTARTGKGVRRARNGRYVVRYGSTLHVTGTVTGADGAPLAGARLGLLRGKAKALGLTADARGRFAARISRPRKAVRLTAEVAGARATLRADVIAALRFTAGKVQSSRRVTIAGRIAVPRVKGLAGRIEVLRGTKVVARIAVRRSGAFRAKVAQPRGKAAYRVRFVPRKSTGLARSFIRVRVRRI